MKIGELASAAQCPVETVRYYEREGLMPQAPRNEANYRVYGGEHVERLGFIRHCRSLDMTLDEIRRLLRLKDAPADDCADVNALLDAHIGHVATRIRELKQLQTQLKSLRAQCGVVQATGDCGILAELSLGAAAVTPADRCPRGRPSAHQAGPAPRDPAHGQQASQQQGPGAGLGHRRGVAHELPL